MAELLAEITAKKLQVRQVYDQHLVQFEADPKLLRMVLQNIIVNAVTYTPEGGQIEIMVRSGPADEVVVGRKLLEDSLVMTVSDTGYGIPDHQKSSLFTKFFRADTIVGQKTEGTGLGLYIARSIVQQTGGEIWFESKEGQGTVFCVVFPLSGMIKRTGSKKLT